MSDFDDFNDASLADAADIIGRESFTITGIAGSFDGILNEFASDKSLTLGGITSEYTATLVCELDQFDDISGSLERTLDGRKLTISGRDYKINRVLLDLSSITLGLANPSGKK